MLMGWGVLKGRLRINIASWLCAYKVFCDALLGFRCVIAHLVGHSPVEIPPKSIYCQIRLRIECLLGLILLRVLTHSSTTPFITEFFCLGYVLAKSVAPWLVLRINLRQGVLVIKTACSLRESSWTRLLSQLKDIFPFPTLLMLGVVLYPTLDQSFLDEVGRTLDFVPDNLVYSVLKSIALRFQCLSPLL